MTITVHEELEQGSQAWLDARCGLVTASTIGQLIQPKTLNPADNETSRSLLRTLVAERITGRVEEQPETWDMLRGTLSEEYARDLYRQHYAPVEECGFMVRKLPGLRIGYSPDGLTEAGLIEVKSPRAKHHLSTLLSGEVPAKYLAQIHAGMLASDRPYCDFISYHPGLPLYVKRVYRNEAWDRALIDAVATFEDRAEEMIDRYAEATSDLPQTEYVDVMGGGEDEILL